MDYNRDFVVKKNIQDQCAYYAVPWSPMVEVDRHRITRTVPARPGLFELFYKDSVGKVKLFYMEKVWYGGLRSEIRRASDPLEVSDVNRRKILSDFPSFYRWVICESRNDLQDILHAYSELLLPKSVPPGSSGRYEKIFIGE